MQERLFRAAWASNAPAVAAVVRDPRVCPEVGDDFWIGGMCRLKVLAVRTHPDLGWVVRVEEIDPSLRTPEPPYSMSIREYWDAGGVVYPESLLFQAAPDGTPLVWVDADGLRNVARPTLGELARRLGLRSHPPTAHRQ